MYLYKRDGTPRLNMGDEVRSIFSSAPTKINTPVPICWMPAARGICPQRPLYDFTTETQAFLMCWIEFFKLLRKVVGLAKRNPSFCQRQRARDATRRPRILLGGGADAGLARMSVEKRPA